MSTDMNDVLLRRMDELESQQALHRLNTAYGRAADRGDGDLMLSLYHEDASVISGSFEGLASDFVPYAISVVRKQERTWHMFSNEWFEIEGDRAIGESYCYTVATSLRDGGSVDNLSGGRYLDTYARREGVWKFTRRVFVLDWVFEQPGNAVPAAGPRGTWAPDDPVMMHWSMDRRA